MAVSSSLSGEIHCTTTDNSWSYEIIFYFFSKSLEINALEIRMFPNSAVIRGVNGGSYDSKRFVGSSSLLMSRRLVG
jgi:hypothetical protein